MKLLADIAPFLSSAFAAAIGYLIARKKNKAELRKIDVETDSLELKNVKDLVDFWRGMVSDLRGEINQLRIQVQAFSKENTELKKETKELKGQVGDMLKFIEEQRTGK